MDGIYDVGLWVNNVIIVPTVDSIQEERIMGADYSAQYGAAAGAVTVVQSKAGTNAFHGSAYEFLRNSALDANTFFNDKNGIKKVPFRRNEYGGTLGGPIRKDKTFFFVDYQGIHRSSADYRHEYDPNAGPAADGKNQQLQRLLDHNF